MKIRKFYEAKYQQNYELEECDSLDMSISDIQKLERESLNPNFYNLNSINGLNSNINKIDINQKIL